MDLDTATMVGAEALLRWQHPTFGLIPPDECIPMAEETGSITAIGAWVLDEAVRWLAARGPDAGLSVSVNVSPAQLEDGDFVERVRAARGLHRVRPYDLVLEITEQGLMSSQRWGVLRNLRELGVRIAIDDFGTGYASLAYLNELSIDLLKIDRSFIVALDGAERTMVVPRAVIQVASSLGLGLIAEGIETVEQLAVLRELGCTRGQGYLFSRPVPSPRTPPRHWSAAGCPAEPPSAQRLRNFPPRMHRAGERGCPDRGVGRQRAAATLSLALLTALPADAHPEACVITDDAALDAACEHDHSEHNHSEEVDEDRDDSSAAAGTRSSRPART